MPNVVASLQDVSFRYAGRAANVLHGVNVILHAGQVVAFMGPNGSGKTTVLGLLSGRLTPTSGDVKVFGGRPADFGRLPQLGVITDPLHSKQSVLPVDMSLRQLASWLQVLDRIAFSEFDSGLEQLGLNHLPRTRSIRQFSKGERQRVALLVTLLRKPRLILADEPLEGLDPEARQIVTRTVQRLAREDGVATLWVSHHLDEALPDADRLLVIENHTVVERPQNQWEVRLAAGDQPDACHVTRNLHVLPSIAEQSLRVNGSIRIEIRRSERCQ